MHTDSTAALARKKILLVEDSPFWQTAIQRSLQNVDKSLQIVAINNAEEFFSSGAKADDFDLIIADHYLGGLKTGLDLWQSLSDSKLRTPFLLTSGTDEDLLGDLSAAGLVPPQFIEKSLVSGDFNRRVRMLLDFNTEVALKRAPDLPSTRGMSWLLALVSVSAAAQLVVQQRGAVTVHEFIPMSQFAVKSLEIQAPIEPVVQTPAVEVNTVVKTQLREKVWAILQRADRIAADAKKTSLKK